ncbi:MAG: hypothetical protein BZ138_07225 [Methanosphaera sp. rholeuAM270]|nr:MAG: hypothetical protein BZ138_07225 [Methanosphaera sp. rholeuAM270]
MINLELMQLIYPNLKIELTSREYKYIEDMFSECYQFTDDKGKDIIALKPVSSGSKESSYLSLCFYSLNGAYAYMEFWDDVKKRGTLI